VITEIVTFKLPLGATREETLLNFEKTSLKWNQNSDLVRKYYLFDSERMVAGGVYLWKTRAAGEKWHGTQFREMVKKLYDAVPESQFYETPIIVDNIADGIHFF
jgi:hypothetical protein